MCLLGLLQNGMVADPPEKDQDVWLVDVLGVFLAAHGPISCPNPATALWCSGHATMPPRKKVMCSLGLWACSPTSGNIDKTQPAKNSHLITFVPLAIWCLMKIRIEKWRSHAWFKLICVPAVRLPLFQLAMVTRVNCTCPLSISKYPHC